MAKRERLGDILIRAGLLSREGLQRALDEQQRWGGPLGQYLVQMDLITEETLVRALSTQFKLPAVALDPPKLSVAVARRIPHEVCERNRLVCFRVDESTKSLDVAMADPSSLDAIDEVRVATRWNVRPFFAAPSAIDASIRHVFYGDMGGGYGGAIDLSPSSSLREDVGGGELSQRARRLSPPATPSPSRSHDALPGAGGIRLPDPVTDPAQSADGIHVSADIIDEAGYATGMSALRERVALLEHAVARNTQMLEGLIDLLVERALLPRGQADKITKKN